MRRRRILQTIGVVVSTGLGGCGNVDDSTSGDDSEPFEATSEELLPPVAVFENAVDSPLEARGEIETGIVQRAQARAAYRIADAESAIPDAVEVDT